MFAIINKMGVYNKDIIDLINLFEKVTRSSVRDCFYHNSILVFVVNEGQASKAIGKKGANILKFSQLVKKRLKIVEYANEPSKFTKNFIAPIKAKEIKFDNNIIEIHINDSKDKGLLIGRDKKNLENFKKVMKTYFKVQNVKIV